MRRSAVSTFIPYKRRSETRRAIFASSQSTQTLSVRLDPDTTRPFDRTATHETCARRGVDERSTCGSTGRRRRAVPVCPLSVRRHRPLDTSHTLSVWSLYPPPETTWPFDSAATQLTCARRGVDERSTCCVDWTPAPCSVRVPAQRPEAPTARHVPHLERVVPHPAPGNDATVRQGGDAVDLRPSRRRRAIDALCRLDAGAALSPCARAASGRADLSTRPKP